MEARRVRFVRNSKETCGNVSVEDDFIAQAQRFCEIGSFLRSHIGIGVWRVVFLGCWMWL